MVSMRFRISSVSPLYDSATTTSSPLNYAEVAVRGFRGVQEERRRAGAGERGGDLLADHAGLAHPRQDHPAAALEEELDGAVEAFVQTLDESEDGRGFRFQHLAGEGAVSHERMSGLWRPQVCRLPPA